MNLGYTLPEKPLRELSQKPWTQLFDKYTNVGLIWQFHSFSIFVLYCLTPV